MEREALQDKEMPPVEPRVWPGKRLKSEREARHLSREEVARQLHQDVRIIKALEEDNYSWLPGQTYVLGYLRSYARLLKLPVDEIIAAAQFEHGETAELLPENVELDHPIPLGKRSRRGWVYVVLILLLLAALGILFFSIPLPFDLVPGLSS